MSHVITSARAIEARSTRQAIGRWMLSFIGFPAGGLAALVLTDPVDTTVHAVVGGLVTGAVLGAVQAWALRSDRRQLLLWTLATALGLGAGLALGAAIVGFDTTMGDLALQGAVTGACVGLTQAVVLRSGRASVVLAWPLYLAGAYALGWVVTTAGGIAVEEQFTTFGAYGALTVTALTSVLPLLLIPGATSSSPDSSAS